MGDIKEYLTLKIICRQGRVWLALATLGLTKAKSRDWWTFNKGPLQSRDLRRRAYSGMLMAAYLRVIRRFGRGGYQQTAEVMTSGVIVLLLLFTRLIHKLGTQQSIYYTWNSRLPDLNTDLDRYFLDNQ